VTVRDDKLVEIAFEDVTTCLTEIVFGADETMSKVRELLTRDAPVHFKYTGVTCIMGMADLVC
jgi:hypothetical protein